MSSASVCVPCCGTRMFIRPRRQYLQHCCQTATVHCSACCAVSTEIDVGRVLCGCTVTSHLLGTLTDATQCNEESLTLYRISTILLHFKMREILMSLKCLNISVIKFHVNSMKSVT